MKRPTSEAFGRLVSKRSVLKELTKALKEELPRLVNSGFQGRRDPADNPWAPRKDSKSHPLLELTGRMRKTITVVAEGAKVHLKSDTNYLKYHQSGTSRMPARRLAPIGELTPRWKKSLDLAVLKALKRVRNGRS